MTELEEYFPGAISSLISPCSKNTFETAFSNKKRSSSNVSKISSKKKNTASEDQNKNALFKSCKVHADNNDLVVQSDSNELMHESNTLEIQPKKLTKKEKIASRQTDNQLNSIRTIFVGNAPIEATRKDIRKIFLPFGLLEAVYQRSLLKKNVKWTKQLLGADRKEKSINMSSTNFFVRFNVETDAKKAVEKTNGQEFKGRFLRVTMSAQKEFGRSTSIYVANLPYEADEEEVRNHFSSCGNITAVRLLHDRNTGRSVGFGYIQFEEKASRESAIQMDGQEFAGRPLRILRIFKKSDKRKHFSDKGNGRLVRGLRRKMRKKEQLALNKISLQKLAQYSTATDNVGKMRNDSAGKLSKKYKKKFTKRTSKGKKVSLMTTK